jgi:large subunit ribosomal protein L5e
MGFVKVVKNKAYYKRYQVKYRRRRDGKTDYYARRRLTLQDKDKYNTPKYRMVVRISNRNITCQVVSAKMEGDHVIAAAYSKELSSYGLPASLGLTSYAAAYATGLLLARRVLTQMDLAKQFLGVEKATGEYYSVADEDNERRPFRVILDVGLNRTTTGARVFGALKGAVDGGLDIPHNTKRFPGNAGEEYDAGRHRDYIFGVHVAEYMRTLQEDDPAAYQRQFSGYIKAGVNADKMEGMWAKVHANIRANPKKEKKARKAPATKRTRKAKLTAPQKLGRARVRLQNFFRSMQQE